MDTLDDIASKQAAPAADEEEKKHKKKRNLLVGLAALAVIGGSAVCVGTGIVDKLKPGPEPTQEVVVRVEPTRTAYAEPLATVVTLSPTPTSPTEAYDVREAWYGYFEGTASGRATNWKTQYSGNFENSRLWLQISDWETCLNEYLNKDSFCREGTLWGIDISYTYTENAEAVAEILLYLPENLSDASNLTITDNRLTITPTEDHPYELVIERVNGQLQGYLRSEGRLLVQWTEDAYGIPEIDSFVADRTTRERNPFGVGTP